jgi:hypothetical protein
VSPVPAGQRLGKKTGVPLQLAPSVTPGGKLVTSGSGQTATREAGERLSPAVPFPGTPPWNHTDSREEAPTWPLPGQTPLGQALRGRGKGTRVTCHVLGVTVARATLTQAGFLEEVAPDGRADRRN